MSKGPIKSTIPVNQGTTRVMGIIEEALERRRYPFFSDRDDLSEGTEYFFDIEQTNGGPVATNIRDTE